MCGILIDDRVDDCILTTLYEPNPLQADWCKSKTVWLDKDPKFITYRVRTPAFYPNAHMFVHEELTDSSETDLVKEKGKNIKKNIKGSTRISLNSWILEVEF